MQTRQKIAIIGSGISGLSAAWLLRERYDVVLYEKNAVLGGHARTLTVDYDGVAIDVDTGFIVFNDRNYPHLLGLFSALQVPFHKSDMSFAASIAEGAFEYSSKSLRGIFPTFDALFDVKRYSMMRDYLRFSRAAKRYLQQASSSLTLEQLIALSGVGETFARGFILPMGAAIWSCPISQMLQYPAETFVRFFDNHGLLDYNGQPQWYTVSGGSRSYVSRIAAHLAGKIKLGIGATRVDRTENGVSVLDSHGDVQDYDYVVFATHAPEAHALLHNPSEQESAIIGAFKTQENLAILHRDAQLMPKNKHCWASWVYLSKLREDNSPSLAITYWMNLLQNIDANKPLFVTLNPPEMPADALIFDSHIFAHPIFDKQAIDAQKMLPSINGKNRIFWCGAWQRYGFHEDGIHSAVNVASLLGVKTPWA